MATVLITGAADGLGLAATARGVNGSAPGQPSRMSARFVCNFAVLVLGAALLVFLFALGPATADWIALGVGVAAVVMALYSFAAADQGVYQRAADVLIAALGAWAIVAARVMAYRGPWLVFGAAAGLAGLGAVGLLVREIGLARGLQVGQSRIGADQLVRLSALQRNREPRR